MFAVLFIQIQHAKDFFACAEGAPRHWNGHLPSAGDAAASRTKNVDRKAGLAKRWIGLLSGLNDAD